MSSLLDEDDELAGGSSRLSSCSLDSVIGYLDQLLGRRPLSSCPAINKTSGAGADEPHRVMDLSFASVYEVPSSCSSSVSSDVTTELVDSGVESNKSDADDSIHFHDYQNLARPSKQQFPGAAGSVAGSRRRHRAASTKVPTVPSPPPLSSSATSVKDDKFYEICLGHFCHRMDAGPDGWISIFSLQKHQDELLELSGSHQQQQQQQQQHRQPPQRQQSSGPIRQASVSHDGEPAASNSSSRNNGKSLLDYDPIDPDPLFFSFNLCRCRRRRHGAHPPAPGQVRYDPLDCWTTDSSARSKHQRIRDAIGKPRGFSF